MSIHEQGAPHPMTDSEYKVRTELFFDEVDIVKEMSSIAAQENCNDHEHELLSLSARYIEYLRGRLSEEISRNDNPNP